MSPEAWQALRDLFRQWTGMILPETIQPAALDVLRRLAGEAGCDALAYLHILDGDQGERQQLLDQLGLGTTWFMRDEAGLHALATTLVQSTPVEQTLWLWSTGCSSGEEPYSLAMTLAEHGRSARILATDLNRLALQRAIQARYAERSLQRLPDGWRQRYFDEDRDGTCRVKDHIRACVTFELHNVLTSAEPPTGWSHFDAVVCRNMLIYFERAQALAIIERLARSCRPGGYLLLGAIERPLFWMTKLATREQVAELVQLSGDRNARGRIVASSRARAPTEAQSGGADPHSRRPAPEDSVQVEALLDRAVHAEKSGRLDDALALIDAAIAREPLWPPAHLARGLVLKHAGRMHEAIDALRASRFLDDHTWLAPYQLGLCLEAVGEAEDALEAYRHALGVLETQGKSGLHKPSVDVESLATTAAEVCRARIGADEL